MPFGSTVMRRFTSLSRRTRRRANSSSSSRCFSILRLCSRRGLMNDENRQFRRPREANRWFELGGAQRIANQVHDLAAEHRRPKLARPPAETRSENPATAYDGRDGGVTTTDRSAIAHALSKRPRLRVASPPGAIGTMLKSRERSTHSASLSALGFAASLPRSQISSPRERSRSITISQCGGHSSIWWTIDARAAI